jgi:hypothetical protein
MADFATEGGHWYQKDGTPRYTLIGKNGNERAVTLRDARVENLVPSVTTIIKCAAAPGLENWKAEQLLLAALTLPRKEGELEADWLARVRADSKAEGREAAELGTKIHGAIEKWFSSSPQTLPVTGEYAREVAGVLREVTLFAPDSTFEIAEKSFASPLGYGGKVDLHGDGFVIDFKGKDFGPEDKVETYDEHAMQLAAYREGLRMPDARCAICFFSRSVPGLAKLIEIPEEKLVQGWGMFKGLFAYWVAAKSYNPMEAK